MAEMVALVQITLGVKIYERSDLSWDLIQTITTTHTDFSGVVDFGSDTADDIDFVRTFVQ